MHQGTSLASNTLWRPLPDPAGGAVPWGEEARVSLESAFCITIYNEEASRLKRTLASVLTSLASRPADRAEEVCLCLIVDGVDRADPDLIAWLGEAGLIDSPLDFEVDECDAFRATCSIAAMLEHLGAEGACGLAAARKVRFITCLKRRNRGKLHSHAIFFRTLCTLLKPEYCIQLDVGTVIADDAYPRLVSHMEQDPAIGAIAPCITTTPPDDRSVFISTWQNVDFVVQKTMFWPFEVASGYLSVIPGQFCILRRSALTARDDTETSLSLDAAPQAAGDLVPEMADEGPIGAYLRGLSTRNPLEKVMFLAEDRVIGSEIVLRENCDYHLEYCAETRAVTDTCLTVPELLRQRRRWTNSALACRLWMLGQIVRFLRREDRSLPAKARFLVAMLGQAMLMVREFASPAITISSVLVFAAIGQSLNAAGKTEWQAALLICFAGILLGGIIPKFTRSRLVSKGASLVRGVLGIALSFTLTAMLSWAATNNLAWTLVLLPGILSLIAMVLVFRLQVVRIFMMLGVYVVTDAVMAPIVSAYSVWKLNDVSWGTKGLTSSVQDEVLAARMNRLRFFGVLAWLLINGALVAAAWFLTGVSSDLLNPAFELICALNIWVTALVLFRLGRQAIQNLQRQPDARRPGRDVIAPARLVSLDSDASAAVLRTPA